MTDKHLDKKMSATAYEIAYIRKLGTHNDETRKLPRGELLRGYIEGSNKRNHWGDIDKTKVINFARKELDKIILEDR